MSTAHEEAMRRLAKSGDLATETFYRVAAGLAIQSALEPLQKQGWNIDLDQISMTRPSDQNRGTSGHQAHSGPKEVSRIAHSGQYFLSQPNTGKKPLTSSLMHSVPSDAEPDNSVGLSSRFLEADDLDRQSDGSGYASTGLGTSALYSDTKSLASHSKRDHQVSQRQSGSGRRLSGLDQAMRMMSYHMGRISFECECHFEDVPVSVMSRADKRHCRRFHKGLIGKKKAGEKRKTRE